MEKIVHYIFSTYKRYWLLDDEISNGLNLAFHNICLKKGLKLINLSILADHVHLLIAKKRTDRNEYIMKMIKGSSAHAILSKLSIDRSVCRKLWARGYRAMPVKDIAALERTIKYINNQKIDGIDKRLVEKDPTVKPQPKWRPRRSVAGLLIIILSMILLSIYAYGSFADQASVRSLGMGSCFVASKSDPDSAILNPASLSNIEGSTLNSLHAKLQTDTELYYLSYSQPCLGGAIGVAWIQAGLPDILQTGSVSGEPEVLGNYSYYSDEYFISYGRDISDNLSAGISLRYSTSALPGLAGQIGSSYGHSASAGLLYSPNDSISFGIKIDNLFNSQYWSTDNVEHEPIMIRIGGSSYFPFFGNKLLIAEDVSRSLEPDDQMRACFGAELSIGSVSFRAGCGECFTAGFGVITGNIELNYGYIDRRILSSENVHRVSLTYYW